MSTSADRQPGREPVAPVRGSQPAAHEPGARAPGTELLHALRRGISIEPQPFATLLPGRPESDTLRHVRAWLADGTLVDISPVLDLRRLGIPTALVLARVPTSAVNETAARVSADPGVSHNYLREATYNLWFTLAATEGPAPRASAGPAASQTAAGRPGAQGTLERRAARLLGDETPFLVLPALRYFKLGFGSRAPGGARRSRDATGADATEAAELSDAERRLLDALQDGLRPKPRPFAEVGRTAGLSEGEAIAATRGLRERSIIRRISGQFVHDVAGDRINSVICLELPEDKIESAGRVLAASSMVSHCIQRPTTPEWPYALYVVAHAGTPSALEAFQRESIESLKPSSYRALPATTVFKKARTKIRFAGQPRAALEG